MNQAKHHFVTLALALISGCTAPAPEQIYELEYGTTEYIPMSDRLATDFIDRDVLVIPPALKKCGTRLIAFNGGITDGGEEAYFSLPDGDEAVKACIKRAFPQAELKLAAPETVAWLRTRKPPTPGSPP